MDDDLSKSLSELSRLYNEAMADITEMQEQYWNSLTKEQQLDAFCCVVRRIHKAELVEQRSYRGTLYDIFDFGPESYAQAQNAGFLELHNSIYSHGYEKKLLIKFAEFLKIENPEQKYKEFLNV